MTAVRLAPHECGTKAISSYLTTHPFRLTSHLVFFRNAFANDPVCLGWASLAAGVVPRWQATPRLCAGRDCNTHMYLYRYLRSALVAAHSTRRRPPPLNKRPGAGRPAGAPWPFQRARPRTAHGTGTAVWHGCLKWPSFDQLMIVHIGTKCSCWYRATSSDLLCFNTSPHRSR